MTLNAASPSVIRAALFTLSGGGDTELFLAPAAALEWCRNIEPGTHALPVALQETLVPFLRPVDPQDEEDAVEVAEATDISSGSADNDAAMFLSGLCRNFDSQRDAIAFAAAQGWQIVDDEYEGYLY